MRVLLEADPMKFHTVALLLIVVAAVLTNTGCVTNMFPGGPTPAGYLYTDVTSPSQYLTVATDSAVIASRSGEASASAILGLIATGDAGIEAAMKDGNITKVHHIDHQVVHFLGGIYVKNKTIVYGR
jgi:hypothetical protein